MGELKVFALYYDPTGDYILAVGYSVAGALETAASSLDLHYTDLELAEDGAAAEMLLSQYGGACVCSGELG